MEKIGDRLSSVPIVSALVARKKFLFGTFIVFLILTGKTTSSSFGHKSIPKMGILLTASFL